MFFRLLSKSVTLNDLERRSDSYFALFFTEFGKFMGVLRKWLTKQGLKVRRLGGISLQLLAKPLSS